MPSKLSQELSPFYVMEVLERARYLESKGENIVHFEVGEPDFDTPGEISNKAIQSIKDGKTKYTESLGLPDLRKSISRSYNNRYGLNTTFENVVVTSGSSPAIFLSMLSLIETGDEVIITNPHYACYPQIIKIAGGIPVKVPIYEQDNFQIDVSKIKKAVTKKTKAVIINSPANPTGVILKSEIMKELSNLDIYIISDEIYHGLEYGTKTNSMLEFTDKCIVVNGFSKLYSMTGWRLGYIIAPREFIRPIQKIQQNLFISPNPFVQQGGITALAETGNKTDEMVEIFNKRRVQMLDGLSDIGLKINYEPNGAFYVFLDVSRFSKNSYELAFDILNKANVAVTPGIDFGENGEGFIRLSYATSYDQINTGLERLADYFNI